jgi:hypothetical protein
MAYNYMVFTASVCTLLLFPALKLQPPPCMVDITTPGEPNRQFKTRTQLSKGQYIWTVHLLIRSCGNSVSIVSDYGLDDRGSIPGRGKVFFL